MKLHATIQEAFNNGKGDCFFTKNNQYVCISRKNIELQNKLINEGYTLLSYSEAAFKKLKKQYPNNSYGDKHNLSSKDLIK